MGNKQSKKKKSVENPESQNETVSIPTSSSNSDVTIKKEMSITEMFQEGEKHLDQGKKEEAMKWFSEVIEKSGDSCTRALILSLFHRGMILYDQGLETKPTAIRDISKAISLFETISLSDHGFTNSFLARLYGIRGYYYHLIIIKKYDLAVVDLKKALEFSQGAVNFHLALSKSYSELKKYDECYDALTRAIGCLSDSPELPEFYYQRALCLEELGKPLEVAEDYGKCLELGVEPKRAKSLRFGRSIIYEKLGMFKEYIEEKNALAEIEPKRAHYHYSGVAKTYEDKLDDLEKAAAVYLKAQKSITERTGKFGMFGWMKRIECFSKLGRVEEALGICAEYGENQNWKVLVSKERGKVFAENKMFREAVEEFSKALEQESEYMYVYLEERGKCWKELGEEKRGEDDLVRGKRLRYKKPVEEVVSLYSYSLRNGKYGELLQKINDYIAKLEEERSVNPKNVDMEWIEAAREKAKEVDLMVEKKEGGKL